MTIWLPAPLYHVFPMLSVVTGFAMCALVLHPLSILTAAGLYIYAFRILWLRTH